MLTSSALCRSNTETKFSKSGIFQPAKKVPQIVASQDLPNKNKSNLAVTTNTEFSIKWSSFTTPNRQKSIFSWKK